MINKAVLLKRNVANGGGRGEGGEGVGGDGVLAGSGGGSWGRGGVVAMAF